MQFGPLRLNGRTNDVRAVFSRFCKDKSGNFAILLAAGALPLFLAAGAAVDYAIHQNSATKLQDILDAAVLAGAEYNGSDSEKRKAAKKYFKALIANEGGYVADAKAKFRIKDSGTISGTAAAETPMFISGVFLKGPMQLGVESAAVYAKKLKSVKFQATDAQGWWEKTVRLMVIRRGSSTPEEVANVHYAVSAAKPPSKGTVKANPSGIVDLGDYETAYMEMTIGPTAYEFDKCAPGAPRFCVPTIPGLPTGSRSMEGPSPRAPCSTSSILPSATRLPVRPGKTAAAAFLISTTSSPAIAAPTRQPFG